MRRIVALFLLLAFGAVLVACQPEAANVSPTPVEGDTMEELEDAEEMTGRGAGGTLNILYWQAASTVNPYLSSGTKDVDASSLVLEPLARFDESGTTLIPWLATEIPTVENGGISEDFTSITWTLQDGILWADGTPLTAEDVAFTADYCMAEEMGCASATSFDGVSNVEALDDVTVQITFKNPTPFPYSPFVTSNSPVLQKAQFEDCMGAAAQECTDENFGPIGTGPYTVSEFRANDVVVYTINENYRDETKPYFSEVIFKGGGDATSAARAVLETGEADYAWNLQIEPEVLTSMEAAGNGKVVVGFATNVERILINFTNPDSELGDQRSEWTEDDANPHPFLSDPVVRQALSMAIDRETIAVSLYGFGGQATCNIWPAPEIYVSTANDSCLVQDIEGANALLDDAGIVDTDGDGIREKDGVPLSILYQTTTNSIRQSTQALIKQWWSQIGVETELRTIDASVFFGNDPSSPDTYGKFYADVQMFTSGSSGVDPQQYMSGWQCSEISRMENNWLGSNIPRWCNAEYDALVAELARTSELEERAEIVKQMNDLVVQNYVVLPLVYRGSVSAHANSLEGVRINAWDSQMWNVADWTRAGN